MGGIRGKALALAAATATLGGVITTEAGAGTLYTQQEPGEITVIFHARPGELNKLEVIGQSNGFTTIRDRGALMLPDFDRVEGCTWLIVEFLCTAPVGTVILNLHDRSDTAVIRRRPSKSSVVRGGPGDDYVEGVHGNETFDGGSGADVMFDRYDFDRDVMTYEPRQASVSVTKDGVANDGEPGENDWVGDDVEVLHGGAGDDVLEGGDGVESLYGHNGDDALRGGGGNDYLEAGFGNDFVFGDSGDDSLSDGPGSDLLDGGDHNDQLRTADDGVIDQLLCGSGDLDRIRFYAPDVQPADCELLGSF